MCEKYDMEPIPHSQHRLICIHVKPVIVVQPATFRRRFNQGKADWNGYSAELGNLIEDVDPTPRELWKVHRVNAYGIQKAYTQRMQITVHPWFIGGITESL